ncbi:hypothetical protein B0H11DRAFT_1719442 [Mycena galericulata]|nr:hypothetical protein B0H11DRAFT_1719442 [Mycena galericulata]
MTPHILPPIQPSGTTYIVDGTRHSSLYLADGNLVVVAPISDGGGTAIFRVHQSMLSRQSPVFASMFTLPHPDANPDMYDGAPFVRMPDDSKDIESLFKVLYNPSKLPYKRLDPLTPIRVRRTLAMATKYEMESLRDRIISQLAADWPTSLPEWDRLETEIRGMEKELKSSDEHTVDDLYLDERLPEPVTAIRLARDFGIPKILPSTFYHLSRLSTEDDWLSYRQNRANLGVNRTARWDLLHADDYKLLLKLREAIQECVDLCPRPNKSCLTPDACANWWRRTNLSWGFAVNDPLDEMRKFVAARPAHSICRVCWTDTTDAIEECRSNMWDNICKCVEEYTNG